jgi:hypothetical protein
MTDFVEIVVIDPADEITGVDSMDVHVSRREII